LKIYLLFSMSFGVTKNIEPVTDVEMF